MVGLKTPKCNCAFKLSAYVDDIIVMIKGEDDVRTVTRVSSEFESICSGKNNWKKLMQCCWENGKIEHQI